MGANEGTMLSEWERCGNTLFYVKTRPHERVGYTYISPSEFSIVKWEEMPEGYVVARMEAPDQADWAVKELLDFRLTSLPPDLFQGFKNWNIVFQHALNDGLSPAEITDLFHHGYSQKQKMTILDALDRGFFAAEIPWRVQTRVVQKQELDETLSDFGVMECI